MDWLGIAVLGSFISMLARKTRLKPRTQTNLANFGPIQPYNANQSNKSSGITSVDDIEIDNLPGPQAYPFRERFAISDTVPYRVPWKWRINDEPVYKIQIRHRCVIVITDPEAIC